MNNHKSTIYDAIRVERIRQIKKWGLQKRTIEEWIMILAEEVGEACQAFLQNKPEEGKNELIQAAAVIVAMFEDSEWEVNSIDMPEQIYYSRAYHREIDRYNQLKINKEVWNEINKEGREFTWEDKDKMRQYKPWKCCGQTFKTTREYVEHQSKKHRR